MIIQRRLSSGIKSHLLQILNEEHEPLPLTDVTSKSEKQHLREAQVLRLRKSGGDGGQYLQFGEKEREKGPARWRVWSSGRPPVPPRRRSFVGDSEYLWQNRFSFVKIGFPYFSILKKKLLFFFSFFFSIFTIRESKIWYFLFFHRRVLAGLADLGQDWVIFVGDFDGVRRHCPPTDGPRVKKEKKRKNSIFLLS